MKKLIRKGEVKEVYELGEEKLEFLFTDNISVFDKIIPNKIPGKGETLCKTAAYWLKKTEDRGFDTHFIEIKNDREMIVERFELLEGDEIDENTVDYRIPLEFISRYYVAGSLHERIQNGELDHEKLGFDEKPDYGDRLPEPHFEVNTKDQKSERILNKEEALSISGLTEEKYDRIKEIVFEIDDMIRGTVEENGLLYVDGKKEFALDEERNIIIVDTFGTADDDRFWLKEEYEDGNYIQKNEEFVRKHYEETGYHDNLMEARREGEEEPPIPQLPDHKVEEISQIYIDLMSRLTDGTYGEKND